MENKKRQYRELSNEIKNRIRKSTSGKPKTEIHKKHISQSMRRYWESIPHKPKEVTMDDLIGKSE